MSSNFEFRPAVRKQVRGIIGLAGGTGSGKTWTSLVLAKGMAGGKRFGLIDTENGRASMYADFFDFDVLDLVAPFTSERYLACIKAAEKQGYPVVVVDQFSHEWEGDGGILDQQEKELAAMVERSKKSGDSRPDYQIEESHKMRAWVGPKTAHKRMMTHLTQMDCQLILNFRAEDKIEMVKEKDDKGRSKTIIRPKVTLTGTDGWVPICERRMPFELTASFLLKAEKPGVPFPIKLQEQHKAFFPPDQRITEEAGRRFAEWAQGKQVSGVVTGVTGGSNDKGLGTPQTPENLDEDDIRDIETECSDNGVRVAEVLARVEKTNGWQSLTEIPKDKKGDLLAWIKSKRKAS